MDTKVHIKVCPKFLRKLSCNTADPEQHVSASSRIEGLLRHIQVFSTVRFQENSSEKATLCPFLDFLDLTKISVTWP